MNWDDYLYAQHPPERLFGWARSLTAFHFCRAYGGHNNDGDHLLAALRLTGDPAELLEALGLTVTTIPPGTALPVAGRPYPPEELARFPTPIPGHPHLDQPGWVTLAVHPAFVWVYADRLTISVADGYDVTEESVGAALAIEKLLIPLGDRVIDPPQNDRNCICTHR
ncbi:hypothetical protein [Nonomuraea typhae]|uniref:hypothetical protein n=1 Tax=Nonomuraea typhae TaxID=2603600 RepID=UPI0012F77402|nr:hypothetical protein [Nonomuraea typhae]